MACYEYLCKKCNNHQEEYLSMLDYKTPQYCVKCGNLLNRIYNSFTIRGFPDGWSTFNDPAIAKPRTELEIKKYREFMENSQPISQGL